MVDAPRPRTISTQTGDQTRKLSATGRCSNQLSHTARVAFMLFFSVKLHKLRTGFANGIFFLPLIYLKKKTVVGNNQVE